LAVKGPHLGARLEFRLDENQARRIARVAKGFGQKVSNYVRGLCLADISRREAQARQRRRTAQPLNSALPIPSPRRRPKKTL